MKNEKQSKKTPTELRAPSPRLLHILLAFFFLMFVLDLLYSRNFHEVPYSEFLEMVNSQKLASVTVSEQRITGELKEPIEYGKTRISTIPMDDPRLTTLLKEKNVVFRAEPKTSFIGTLLFWLLPILLIYFIWIAVRGRFGNVPTGMLGLTRSRAKVYVEKDIKITFSDVAGVEEAKAELQEVVRFLADPKKYSRLGGRAPKGILLIGPPGTGKTLLARAVAGEAKVPFLSINGSEFIEMFVGLGAARVRDLFQQSRQLAPCILFIDEIDALGRARVPSIASGSHEEKEQTLGQLLAEMDGFDPSQGVIILAATNRPEILDPALLRAGRFDRQVLVNTPDQHGRTEIMKVHSKKITLDPNVKLEKIAALTPGFSGADLANLVNEAALFATRRNADSVTERDFTMAIERIVAGLEQKSKLMNPQEKRRIAFHEMGHATVALALNADEKVHKVSIIPRGMGALGYTLRRPTEDRYLMDRNELMQKISVLLGGRAAETVYFSAVSTGAADDLVKATDMARAMVTQFGMSESVGLTSFDEGRARFLAGAYGLREGKPFSEETARQIDHEVKQFLELGFQLSLKALKENRMFIEAGAKRLLEIETIDEPELLKLWDKYGTSFVEKKSAAV